MKVKTSVTLSEELLDAIAAESGSLNRSAIIETATWEYLKARRRRTRDSRELELINTSAAALNEEAADTLAYQDDE